MANAKKLPSGAWRVQVYAGKTAEGKRTYKSFTHIDKKQAEYLAAQYAVKHHEITRDQSKMTVGEAIDAYIIANENMLSPSTKKGYKKIKRNYMQEIIDKKLSDLTPKIISKEINREAGLHAPKTVYNAFGLLKTILKEYRQDFDYELTLPTIYPTIEEVPMGEELSKIYEITKGTPIEIPVLLASWLGLRMSEIRGLKWGNVLEDRIIIDTAMVDGDKGAEIKGTKTRNSTRVISLPTYIKERMDAHGRAGEYVTDLSGAAIYKRFIRICEKAGLPKYRFHDLRHSNASVMLEENVPDKYIAERGGWGSDIYKKRYEHTTTTKHDSVNKTIDKRFEALVSHEKQHDI